MSGDELRELSGDGLIDVLLDELGVVSCDVLTDVSAVFC